jgi:hypothetical protein
VTVGHGRGAWFATCRDITDGYDVTCERGGIMELQTHANGHYSFLPGKLPYSLGVVAGDGYELVWVTLRRPLPLAEGIGRAAAAATEQSGAASAVCALALRNPAPLSLEEFASFNRSYRALLDEYGVVPLEAENPVARTNVVPVTPAPQESVVYGFGYSRPVDGPAPRTFIAAGAAEIRNQARNKGLIVRPGDVSSEGLGEKAAAVLDEVEHRIGRLGATWGEVNALNVYTRHELTSVRGQVLERLGEGAIHGIRWFPSTPPVEGLELEIDVRGVRTELMVD